MWAKHARSDGRRFDWDTGNVTTWFFENRRSQGASERAERAGDGCALLASRFSYERAQTSGKYDSRNLRERLEKQYYEL